MAEPVPLLIVGAGGHGHVVADAAPGSFRVLGFVDEHPEDVRDAAHPLINPDGDPNAAFIAAIGDNAQRRRLFEQWTARGRSAATVIHASAVVSRSATLGGGVFVAARVVVNPRAAIGDNVILNTGCIIEHDCRIAAHAHVAPGAALAGGVSVGEASLVGMGACVLPGVRIGAGCVIGAGAVVTKDVPDGATVVGCPARNRG